MPTRRYCCECGNGNKKYYQLVIMHENGMTYCIGRAHDWDGIQQAVKEMRELYAKHGIQCNVGYHEV